MSKSQKLLRDPKRFFADMVAKRFPMSPGDTTTTRPPSVSTHEARPSSSPSADPFAPVKDAIPTDHARQTSSREMTLERLAKHPARRIVDLGCGNGNAYDWLRAAHPKLEYVGVDIEWSPQVATRTRADASFVTYDGIHMPFETDSVELIHSNQVLEHVRYPHRLLPEIARVLRPDGVFIGSVSQMEPYHSFSIYNFTIYGVKTIFEEAGLHVIALRPSIDAISLIGWWRHISERSHRALGWKHESAMNYEIDLIAQKEKWSVYRTNCEKLHYSGHICFAAVKAKNTE